MVPPLDVSGVNQRNSCQRMSVGEKHREQLGITDTYWDFTSSCPGQGPGHLPTAFLCSGIVWEVFHQNEMIRGACYWGNISPDDHLRAWGDGDGALLSQPCPYLKGLVWGLDPLAYGKWT